MSPIFRFAAFKLLVLFMGKNTIKIFSAERLFFFFLRQLTGFKNWKFLNRKKKILVRLKSSLLALEKLIIHTRRRGELFHSFLPYHSLPLSLTLSFLLLPSLSSFLLFFLPFFFILSPFSICCKAGWWYWILLTFACLKSFLFLHQFWMRSLLGTVVSVVDFSLSVL